MELTLYNNLQVDSFTSVLKGSSTEINKTALNLLENIQSINEDQLPENITKVIELVIDEKAGSMIVSGVQGSVKVFNNTRKLLLIQTARNNQAQFKISHLKKGRYILEAEHQFFEFVK